MSHIIKSPDLILKNIIHHLNKGVKNRDHGFHTPVFNNISELNIINSRIVVLRKFDSQKLILNFHTDYRSNKIQDLHHHLNTFFLFYDSSIKIQLRIKTSSIIHYKDRITKNSWALTSLSSRKCYLVLKAPSSKTNVPEDGLPHHLKGINPTKIESELGYKNFVVVENKILHIDWLHLASQGHRRLSINFTSTTPSFQWIIP